jgi:hypothetical protein
MIALILAAQIAAAVPPALVSTEVHQFPAPQRTSETPNLLREPAYCRRDLAIPTAVDRRWRAVPETLDKQPPAQVELAVDRSLGGCRVRTVIRNVVEGGGFAPGR